jgi:hypothetical protein
LKSILALAALLIGAASAAPLPPAPSYCPVVASARPDSTPGFYTVTVTLAATCPPDAVAEVHLESYIGGAYPHPQWFDVTHDAPLIRSGIPWYWRLARRVPSGFVYRRSIPGMVAPF